MSRMKIRVLFLLLSLLMLTSCVGMGMQEPAPYTIHSTSGSLISSQTYAVGYNSIPDPPEKPKSVQKAIIAENLQPPTAPAKRIASNQYKSNQYRVRPGDTMYSVSRSTGVSVIELAKANNIRAPHNIYVGQVLRLPGKANIHSAADVRLASFAPPKAQYAGSGYLAPPQKPVSLASVPPRSSSKFMRPVEGKIISAYGSKTNDLQNDGINIRAPRGTPVRAAENGVIVYVGDAVKGSGNLILIRHQDKWMTAYAHLDRIFAHKGQTVRRGDTIGTVGSTGSVSDPQLHFEIRKGTKAINPASYI